ncbi:MAG: hypothetical protein U0Q20_08810 [Mycobacterium sp.]|nr:hypothetical protein [Mycobacterium sp.]
MGLFGRSPGVSVEVAPAVVGPRQMVGATVSTGRPVDRVTSATLEWGYTNFYRYHWAGRADSAMAEAAEDLWLYGDVGTNAGGDRDTDDWVGVTKVELPIVNGEFSGGSSSFRVPSWAPGSSPELVRWSCRVVVERAGRDVDTHAEFDVRIGRGDVVAESGPTEVIMGDAETRMDIDLVSPVVMAGSAICGQVRLTPARDLPDGDVAVCWRKSRESHPLTRTPSRGGALDGPIIGLGKHLPLRAGSPLTLPFEVPLPVDAPPTANAVHSSMKWFVQARLFYSGLTAPMTERVLRPIVVVNAP